MTDFTDKDTGVAIDDEDFPEIQAEWVPKDLHDVEWLMGIMQSLEAEARMHEGRVAEITRNLEAMARIARGKKAYLEYKYGQSLEEFARKALDGKKIRSIPTAYGRFGWRKTPGHIKVLDKEMAVAFCEEVIPEAIAIKKEVHVSALKDIMGELPDCFEVEYPQDKFYVKTTGE